MKRIAVLFFAVFGVIVVEYNPGFAGGMIASKNQVVLTAKPDKIVSAGFWIPTKRQTSGALRAIDKYLAKLSRDKRALAPGTTNQNASEPTESQINKIRKNLLIYRVQFIGIIFEGRKVIYCNFFTFDHDKFAQWKNEYVDVSNGGTSFWQIDYNVKSKQCSNLTINNEM